MINKIAKGVSGGLGNLITPEVVNLGVKVGNDLFEKRMECVTIPDLKDVLIDEALKILKDDLDLVPAIAVANPSVAYADESENEVVSTEPRFGSKVNPKSAVKVYYLTQEVIEKSQKMLTDLVTEFKTPNVVGLNLYEAREDLENFALKVKEKLEKPNVQFVDMEDGQVTRFTYPGDRKIGAKMTTGERVWLHYVSEEVILESKAIKESRDLNRKEKLSKFGQITKNVSRNLIESALDAPLGIANRIGGPFGRVEQDVTNEPFGRVLKDVTNDEE